jgi:hypothetical protein
MALGSINVIEEQKKKKATKQCHNDEAEKKIKRQGVAR